MNSKSKGAMLAMMSMALMADNYGRDVYSTEPIEIQPRPPKGAKQYFFASDETDESIDESEQITLGKRIDSEKNCIGCKFGDKVMGDEPCFSCYRFSNYQSIR